MKKLLSAILAVMLLVPFISMTVFADKVKVNKNNTQKSLTELYSVVTSGIYIGKNTAIDSSVDVKANSYKTSGGGNYLYTEITNAAADGNKGEFPFHSAKFDALTANGKRKFLGDVFKLCNAAADDTARGYNTAENAITDETVNQFMMIIQDESGMGSQLLATLLQNTKPNYVAANRIYQPFSGVVGTILGLGAVLIIAFLGITMVLDIAYITIPAFQLALGTPDDNKDKKSIAKIISVEARNAVQATEQQGNNDSEGNKLAIGIYFKQRWIGLTVLGIALLYLVQGQVYTFVAMIIDLFSGFLGF